MQWTELKELQQLSEIKKESAEKPVLIFKHSTRCSTSRMTLERLERHWKANDLKDIKPYFLDLLSFREISNTIADHFGVEHESPQILIIWKGESILDLSHLEINYDAIKKAIKN
ncbi:MAG: bacillithiol system redox-active protein YtxJ [Bacteroidota bacterium]